MSAALTETYARHTLDVDLGWYATSASVIVREGGEEAVETLVFCYPGGGYGRGYFDMHPDGRTGYSQAEHHARRGIAVIALDHVVPARLAPGGARVHLAAVASLNARAAVEVLRRLASGVVPGLRPAPRAVSIGVGQSMGAALLTVQQAEYRSFDAVALLGWSVHRTALPDPPRELGGIEPRSRAHFRWAYHWDSEPEWLIEEDIGPGYPERQVACPPWGSAARPVPVADVLQDDCVAPWAARIEVPVLLGFGQRDVAAQPGLEPAGYRGSPRVELAALSQVSHMHNFGPGRERLWDRLTRFYDEVAKGAV